MKEQRNFIRYPAEAIAYKSSIDGRKCENICRDISLGGVRIPETVRKGEVISLQFSFTHGSDIHCIDGICVRNGTKNSSLKFTNINSSNSTLIRIGAFIEDARKCQEYDFQYLLKNISTLKIKNQLVSL